MKQSCDIGDVLKLSPFHEESVPFPARIRNKIVSPYKIILVLVDFILINAGFIIVESFSSGSSSLGYDARQLFAVCASSLIIMSFFSEYRLYNYHLIFSKRNHLKELLKALCLGTLTLGITVLITRWPAFLAGRFALSAVFVFALGLMLLSRFLWNQIVSVLKCIGVSFLAVGLLVLVYGDEQPFILTSLNNTLLGVTLSVGLLFVGRILLVDVVFNKLLRRHFRKQILIIGTDDEARNMTNHIVSSNAPFWVAGVVGRKKGKGLDAEVHKDWLGRLEDLPDIVVREKIDEILLTDDSTEKGTLISLLDFAATMGITVWFPPKLLPIIDIKLYIDNFCGLPAIRMCTQKNNWLFNKIKYGFDALITLPATLVLLPLFLAIGIAIKRDSRGPIFYRTTAVGKDGKEFTMYKFRSMKAHNGNGIHKEFVTKLIKGEMCEEERKGKPLKIADDPRVTSVGRILRKYSLDELPQLINVLKGDMSLVGPRPCLPYEYELYQDWHKKRLGVRPGISGIWQVAGRSAVTFEDMVLLDLYYVYNRNISMDLSIIYETLFAVLEKRGAY